MRFVRMVQSSNMKARSLDCIFSCRSCSCRWTSVSISVLFLRHVSICILFLWRDSYNGSSAFHAWWSLKVAIETWLDLAVCRPRQKCGHIFGAIMSKISTSTSWYISAHLIGSFTIMFSNIFLTLSIMRGVASNEPKSALRTWNQPSLQICSDDWLSLPASHF